MRTVRRHPAVLALARATAVAAALVITGGCHRGPGRENAVARPIALEMRNHGVFDVAVEVVQSGGARGRRLATVTAYATATVTLRAGDLQPPGTLAVRVHAIGSRYAWVSPTISVAPDLVAYLDVYTDRNGDPSRSSLWAAPVAATVGSR